MSEAVRGARGRSAPRTGLGLLAARDGGVARRAYALAGLGLNGKVPRDLVVVRR